MSETVTENQDYSASSPGTILKRCREFHRISIDEAAESTKIGSNYLIALENDRIGEFASIAYLKGFLRIYSSFLGLNPNDMIRLFERLYEAGGDEAAVAGTLAGKNGSRSRHWFSWQKLVMPSILLVLLIITAFFMDRTTRQQEAMPAPPPKVEQAAAPTAAVQPVISSTVKPAARPKAPEEAAPVETAKQETAVEERKEPPRATPETGRSFIVRMKVLQNGKLSVTIDGLATQQYDLSSGDVIEWKANSSIAFDLSNSGGVEAELNGSPLKSFGPVGKPAYVVLGADGIKN